MPAAVPGHHPACHTGRGYVREATYVKPPISSPVHAAQTASVAPEAKRNRMETDAVIKRNRDAIAAALAAAFALASTGAPAMSPGEHDYTTDAELERLYADDRDERVERSGEERDRTDVDGRVGEIRFPNGDR